MTTNTDPGIRDDATDRAKEEISRVAEAARTEAGEVVDVARDQGQRLLEDAQQSLTREAENQTRRASENLRSLSSEFRTMAETSSQQGSAATWVRMGADGIESFADRLDSRGLEGVVQDVGDFARKSPTTFLAITFGAGLLVGRFVKNMDGQSLTHALRDSTSNHVTSPNTPVTSPSTIEPRVATS